MRGRSEVTSALLEEAWEALSGDSDLLGLVTVSGDGDGLLPSIHAALPAMLAAVAVSTLAASVLDAARSTRAPARVLIDAEHVAVAARSERYALNGASEPANPFAPLSRFWRTGDGWLRLHANYPWHRDRALRVLECEGTVDAVGAAILGWQGEDLEDALAAAGAVGHVVRSTAEWESHPQRKALAALPLLETTSCHGGGREIAAGSVAQGFRVLDLTRVIAGPVATRTLAAWGAEVLRVDSPHLPEIPSQALDTLPGKRSTLLDLTDGAGRARIEELLSQADVLVQGYRPGALARYGLSDKQLAERHPHLTVITLSTWGVAGPWADRRGFDSMVQCPTGIAAAEGTDDRPGALPAQILDHATGYLAAAAVMLTLADVQLGSPPRSSQLSLAQTAQWLKSAGTFLREPERDISPACYVIELSGATEPVHLVAPPGQAGTLRPSWSATTEFGSDPPTFAGLPGRDDQSPTGATDAAPVGDKQSP